MKKYIHIEGVDLSGKTSVARAFVDRQGEPWDIRSGTLCDDNPLRELADELCETGLYGNDTLGMAYAAALKADLDLYTAPERDTVQESTILLRSLAYHAINGNHGVLRLFEEMAPYHPKFDDSFMLTASHAARLERLESRAHNTEHDLMLVRDPRRFYSIEDSVKDYSQELFGTQIIDTTDMTIAEVATYIDGKINSKVSAVS